MSSSTPEQVNNVSAPFSELVDELIGIAREAGHLESRVAQYEHDCTAYPARTFTGRRARKFLRSAKQDAELARARLASARSRLLRAGAR